ncbi:FtsW/RodA/SpoVE family cell cycle protein [Neobacillus mesonae]|nr:FtsW/RodA/SpoVE family cell cycle protein [Neobacillus mesonae]
MRQFEDHNVIREFLDQVCAPIRAKQMHSEIREELKSHIEERMESLRLEGSSEDTIAERAVKDMGEPYEIGQSLNTIHRPVTDWKLLLLIALLTAVGLFGALSVQFMDSTSQLYKHNFDRYAFYMGLGFVFFTAFYFLNYQKLKAYSAALFLIILALMTFSILFGIRLNGMSGYLALGMFSFNICHLSVLPLLLTVSGMKPSSEWGKFEGIYRTMYLGVLPIIIQILANQSVAAVLYFTGFTVITWMNKKNISQFIYLSVLPSIVLTVCFLFRKDYLMERVQQFIRPDAYMKVQAIEAIRDAGWFGQGFAAMNTRLPYIHHDSIFPYLIYCFGWGFALLLGVIVTLFLLRMWSLRNEIRDVYGKLLVTVTILLFGIRLVWPILSAFGFLPMVSIIMPFIGYSGSFQVLDFAAIGLLLSIYRRKNMIPSLRTKY